MNLTVPNLMMAGVVGLGLFAAYRLIKTKSEDVSPEGTDGELALLGDPLKLSQNRYYSARLRLRDGGMPPFTSSASRSDLAQALGVLGFTNVTIYMSANELPANWPNSSRNGAGPDARWFTAQWALPSVELPRPPDVEQIWISKPPSDAIFAVSGVGNPFANLRVVKRPGTVRLATFAGGPPTHPIREVTSPMQFGVWDIRQATGPADDLSG